MEVKNKLEILADAAKYDASCASSASNRKGKKGELGSSDGVGICHSYTPDGRCISLLKILFTNHCIYDCNYCINRISSNVKRAKFEIEEIVSLTIEFYKRNYIEGLFLSSGIIKSSDYTMEQLVEVARRLRVNHKFNGYIHLKAVAGASHELLDKASLYADRLSANIELAEEKDLITLAPGKTHQKIEKSMSIIKRSKDTNLEALRTKLKSKVNLVPAGQSTQMMVGATKTTDRVILLKANNLYKGYNLKRVYYTAFSPIPDSHSLLPSISPPLIREHRLYQADWLLRFYNFNVDEIVPKGVELLDLDQDPKLSWALRNRHVFPIDINKASIESIIRVPGIGMRNAQKIISARRFKALRFDDLKKMKISLNKAKFFIVTKDFNPHILSLDKEFLEFKKEEQLSLFSEDFSSLTGEV